MLMARAVTMQAPAAKARTRASGVSSRVSGRREGRNASRSEPPQRAISMAPAAPRMDSTRASIMSCDATVKRVAPRLRRTAISFLAASPRASIKPAMFAQTSSRSTPTAPIRTSTATANCLRSLETPRETGVRSRPAGASIREILLLFLRGQRRVAATLQFGVDESGMEGLQLGDRLAASGTSGFNRKYICTGAP